jgi:hypothetical protein
MVFKMSYGAADKPPVPAAKVVAAPKAPPRRRVKPSLTSQAQALFEPQAPATEETTTPDPADHHLV